MKTKRKQRVQVRKKFKNLKKEQFKRIGKNSLNLLIASLFGGFVLLKVYHFLFFSSYFNLKQIEITGNKSISGEKIKESLNLSKKENIFLLTKEKINKSLAKDIIVKDIILTRDIPDKLFVKIIERIPVGYCKVGGKIQGIDDEGVVFDCDSSKNDYPLISVKNVETEEMELKSAIGFLKLKQKYELGINEEIAEIMPLSDGKLTFLLKDGTKIFFGKVSADDIKLKMFYLEKVFADLKGSGKKIDYINMQYFSEDTGKVIVKLHES